MDSSIWNGARLRQCIGSAAVILVSRPYLRRPRRHLLCQPIGWKRWKRRLEFQRAMGKLPWNVRLFGIRNTSPWRYRLLRPKQHLAGFRNWWDFLTGGVTYIGNSWGSGSSKAHLQATSAMESGVVTFTDHPTIPTIFQGFNVDANGQVTSGVNINRADWWLQNGATNAYKIAKYITLGAMWR